MADLEQRACLVEIDMVALEKLMMLPDGLHVITANFDPLHDRLLVRVEGDGLGKVFPGATLPIRQVLFKSRTAKEGEPIPEFAELA